MDPDDLLERIRELATNILRSHQPSYAGLAWDLADTICTLDTQMSDNKEMPSDWWQGEHHKVSKTIQERLDS